MTLFPGVFEGKLGTKRFCSSKDWGNYCEYQQRPGDVQEYRSCVLSCSGEHCNAATTTSSTVSTLALAAVTTAIIMLS